MFRWAGEVEIGRDESRPFDDQADRTLDFFVIIAPCVSHHDIIGIMLGERVADAIKSRELDRHRR